MNANRRRLLLGTVGWPVAASLAGWFPLVQAQSVSPPAEVAQALPGARLQGQGRLRFLGLQVYDARLWVSEGFEATRFADHALALELIYARKLVGKLIAERSLEEMRRVPGVADEQAQQWLADMTAAFPDVDAKDRITGFLVPGRAARFFFNGRLQREIADKEFAQRFFGIWLAEATSQPALRQSLLGRSA